MYPTNNRASCNISLKTGNSYDHRILSREEDYCYSENQNELVDYTRVNSFLSNEDRELLSKLFNGLKSKQEPKKNRNKKRRRKMMLLMMLMMQNKGDK